MQKTIYIADQEIWDSVKEKAGKKSVSSYLVGLHFTSLENRDEGEDAMISYLPNKTLVKVSKDSITLIIIDPAAIKQIKEKLSKQSAPVGWPNGESVESGKNEAIQEESIKLPPVGKSIEPSSNLCRQEDNKLGHWKVLT